MVKHSVPQDEINEIIYQAALKFENVVRLKGGDPLYLDVVEKKQFIF